jgi:hypothetical protein
MKREVHSEVGGFPPLEYAEDSAFLKKAVTMGYNFGVLQTPEKTWISPRRFEEKGILRVALKIVYLNSLRVLGHEFYRGKTEINYWEDLNKDKSSSK